MEVFIIPKGCTDFFPEMINDLNKIDNFSAVINEQDLPFFFEDDNKFIIAKGSKVVLEALSELGVNIKGVKDLGIFEVEPSIFSDFVPAFNLKDRIEAVTLKEARDQAHSKFQERVDRVIEEMENEQH